MGDYSTLFELQRRHTVFVELGVANGQAANADEPLVNNRRRSQCRNGTLNATAYQSPLSLYLVRMARLLELFGLFPGGFHRKRPLLVRTFASYLYSTAILGLCGATMCFTLYVVKVTVYSKLGVFSLDAISSIINATKPLHCTVNLIFLSFMCSGRHRKLLCAILEAEAVFRRDFVTGCCFNVHRRTALAVLITVFIIAVPATMRWLQVILLGEVLGLNNPMAMIRDASLVVVPLLSVWQMLPIMYIAFLTSLLRAWFRQLDTTLRRGCDRPLSFYYERYILLTRLTHRFDRAFAPVLSASTAISVFVLCLAIYFVSHAPAHAIMVTYNDPRSEILARFYVSWSLLQIFKAFFYVLAICVIGYRTNERARFIGTIVSEMIPKDDQESRLGLYFVNKTRDTFAWQLKMFGTFPIERSTLFTIATLLLTYAVALFRLSSGSTCQSVERRIINEIHDLVNSTTIV